MKRKLTLIVIAILMAAASSMAQPAELITQYGPPEEANTWEKFTIPLTAETFGVDESEFELALQNITSLWIGTEMHTGDDVGSLDEVMLGNVFFSDFNFSFEGWSSGGDGTMDWIQEGGYDGAYLQISDWATGEYHFLIAPAGWAGDWSALNGQNLEFWYKTDHPSYAADIKLTTEVINRLVMVTPSGNVVAPNDSVLVDVKILPAAENDMQVNFSTSDASCISVPASVQVSAGDTMATVYFHAAEGAEFDCISVIEATASGYLTSRLTMSVLESANINETKRQDVAIFPNPCSESFELSVPEGISIDRLSIFSLSGRQMLDKKLTGFEKEAINVSHLPPGIYFMEITGSDKSYALKLIVE